MTHRNENLVILIKIGDIMQKQEGLFNGAVILDYYIYDANDTNLSVI